MVDLHTHVLPQMDDGSQSPEQSLQMLQMMAGQGVDIAVATPHFYAHKETPQAFLQRRRESYAKIADAQSEVKLLLGAEVAYFSGMSACRELTELCIEGSRLLLVEMPFVAWSNSVLSEIVSLRSVGIMPVLAHVERYRKLPDFWRLLQQLQGVGVLAQCNAGSLCTPIFGKRLISMLQDGNIRFLGSDCHNTTSRPPDMQRAMQRIARFTSPTLLQRLDTGARTLLQSP